MNLEPDGVALGGNGLDSVVLGPEVLDLLLLSLDQLVGFPELSASLGKKLLLLGKLRLHLFDLPLHFRNLRTRPHCLEPAASLVPGDLGVSGCLFVLIEYLA